MANVKKVETEDGSCTLQETDRGLLYASHSGARLESRHIYVNGTGLFETEPPWRVLEFGFGAGVNFHETLKRRDELGLEGTLIYHTVENSLVSPGDVDFHAEPYGNWIRGMLREAPKMSRFTFDNVEVALHCQDWNEFEETHLDFDSIYYDPFGPKATPECWGQEAFEIAYESIDSEGVLGTFSAAVDIRERLEKTGFFVQRAPGPGSKRHVTFASKSKERLQCRVSSFDDV